MRFAQSREEALGNTDLQIRHWRPALASLHLRVLGRIVNPRLLEPPPPQDARVAVPARVPLRVGVVAGVRYGVVDAEGGAAADDVGFGEREEGRDDAGGAVLDAAAGAFYDHVLEGVEELGA